MALWVGLIGAGMQAIGQHQQGQADEQQAKQQAMLARSEGDAAERQSLSAEELQRKNAREFLGRQAAAFAEGGSGSGAQVMNQSAINAELDALNVRYRGQLSKFGYKYNARSLEEEGSAKSKSANLSAGASLLRGASNYYASANG